MMFVYGDMKFKNNEEIMIFFVPSQSNLPHYYYHDFHF